MVIAANWEVESLTEKANELTGALGCFSASTQQDWHILRHDVFIFFLTDDWSRCRKRY